MLDWFPDRDWDDNSRLETWRGAASNFDSDQPTDHRWHVDGYEQLLGEDTDGFFARAADQLLRFHFFPPEIMHTVSDFSREGRRMQPGDYLLQRVHVLPHTLDVLTLNQVVDAIYESGRIGVTFRTTERHLEVGEWTAAVVRRSGGEAALLMHAVSKAGPGMPLWARPFFRPLQLRAHRAGLAYFLTRLKAQPSGK